MYHPVMSTQTTSALKYQCIRQMPLILPMCTITRNDKNGKLMISCATEQFSYMLHSITTSLKPNNFMLHPKYIHHHHQS